MIFIHRELLDKVIELLLSKFKVDKLWINPDCGLKTRGYQETLACLKNMVEATKKARAKLQ